MHPIDEELNLPPSDEVKDVFGMNLELPENPNMTTVVNLALQQYKNLVDNAMLLEPESQVEILELAKEFLNLAKDTMYKESDLAIKSRRAEIQALGKEGNKAVQLGVGADDTPKALSYDDVLDQIAGARDKKKKPR